MLLLALEKQGHHHQRQQEHHHQRLRPVWPIVTKYQGRLGRGTGSRVEGRHLKNMWYEGGIPPWYDEPKFGSRPNNIWVDDPGAEPNNRCVAVVSFEVLTRKVLCSKPNSGFFFLPVKYTRRVFFSSRRMQSEPYPLLPLPVAAAWRISSLPWRPAASGVRRPCGGRAAGRRRRGVSNSPSPRAARPRRRPSPSCPVRLLHLHLVLANLALPLPRFLHVLLARYLHLYL